MLLAFGHLGTLLTYIQSPVDQSWQVLFSWTASHPLLSKPVELHEVVTQMQDTALGFVEHHTVAPQLVQIPLQSSCLQADQLSYPTWCHLQIYCRCTQCCPAKHPPIQATCSHFVQEDGVGEGVKGFTIALVLLKSLTVFWRQFYYMVTSKFLYCHQILVLASLVFTHCEQTRVTSEKIN